MPDREKVIKALHDARRYLEDKEWSDRGASPHIDSINDAIALLKDQEAVKPRTVTRHGKNPQIQHFCGKCNAILFHHKQKFCIECGHAVEW